jgi:nitrite reductase (NADH) small subunit
MSTLSEPPGAAPARSPEWVDVADVGDLRGRRTLAVNHGDLALCVLWYADEDRPVAFHDVCIHKQRSLSKGVILNNRLVCPGHQWAYELGTGYCRERDRHQPTYRAEVVGGRVRVDVSAPVAVETSADVNVDQRRS